MNTSISQSGRPPLFADAEVGRVTAPVTHAWTLPPSAYTDPNVYDREVPTIFDVDWMAVARSSQLGSAGDQVAVEVSGRPILLTRDADGEIRALSNVCLHRSMPLVEERSNARYITCPYHRWSYRLDGSLHAAPLMDGAEGFDPTQCRLPQVAVEEWEGFVFVSLDADRPALGPRLEPLRQIVEPYGLADLVIAGTLEYDSPWNWKLLVENFMEAYHHIGPHRETLQPDHPAAMSSVIDNGGGPWSLLRMPGTTDPDARAALPTLPGLTGDGRTDLLAASVYPTLLFAASSTLCVWYEVLPLAHDRMNLRIHLLLEPAVAANPDIAPTIPSVLEGLAWIHGEDIAVNTGPWRGLHSPLATQGRLSPYEAAIWQFNQWWIERVT